MIIQTFRVNFTMLYIVTLDHKCFKKIHAISWMTGGLILRTQACQALPVLKALLDKTNMIMLNGSKMH